MIHPSKAAGDEPTMPAILVPLDGSPLAEQTLSVGASFARRSGAELHLVRVIDPVPAPLLAGEGPQDATGIERELGAHAEGYLRWLAGATHAIQGLSVATAVLDRPVVPALCEYVQAHGIDLAVMTTHGRGGVRRWCLGSVATELLRRVTCPVLLLHDQELPQPTEFRRIVVALDGEVDRPVLEAAMALGSLDPQSQCFLTRVVEPAIPILTPLAARPAHLGPHENERREIEARNYLAAVIDRLQGEGLRVTPRVLVGRGIADQVLELAYALGADCIVVGTHGLRGAERVLIGSVADRIVHGADVPVLVSPTRAPVSRTTPPPARATPAVH